MRGFRAEELAAKLFLALGYRVEREIALSGVHVDMVVTKNGTPVPVEVVARTDHRNILNKLSADAARLQSVFSISGTREAIIAVFGPLSPAAKNWSETQFGLTVWGPRCNPRQGSALPGAASRADGFRGWHSCPASGAEGCQS